MPAFRSPLRALAALSLVALLAAAPPVTGLDLANLDTGCKACDDFFTFATGGWNARHPIPAGHPRWGSFDELAEQNRATLHAILEEDAKDASSPPGSDAQKLGAFYRSCMDEPGIERAGTTPIAPLLALVDGAHDPASIALAAGRLDDAGVSAGPDLHATPDTKDSSKTIAGLGLSGLGLPDPDYYLQPARAKILDAYRAYVATQLGNLGEDERAAASDAAAVVALETTLAKASPSLVERRDPVKTYHPTPVRELAKLAPHVPWAAYFAAAAPPAFETIDVAWPAYVEAYDAQLAATPLATWKAYQRFHVADAYARALPKRFSDAAFAFRSGVLFGVKQELPRWERCTAATDASLRDVLGKAYVARAFSPAAKMRAQAMVDSLQRELRADITTLPWMSPATKTKALVKLDAFTKKIGYPDRWEDYSGLTVADRPYAENVEAASRFAAAQSVARIGRPTDRFRWYMTPPTVNAYYSPSGNEIVFPAGILQPPFFDPNADDAVNYGAIGAVIGHEMTHGFDNHGRQFDGHGNLADWWTPQDAQAFAARAQCIIDQYDAEEPLPGVHENGKLVQGEAIADLGGITIAYRAFEKTAEAKAHRSIDGYTPEQRFFLAYAQDYRGTATEAFDRFVAQTNEHPVDRIRVLATLANMPEFARAFGCTPKDKMVRRNACRIW